MVIGIDASRAFIPDRTGTENYSYHLIKEILRLPESKIHTFVLFIRPNMKVPTELDGYTNVIIKVVPWRYLWTQLGLAWATWGKFSNHKFSNSQMDVLWVPAHTLPIFRNPHIKTVVTIHGLEYQWLPEYKNLLQRWYLPLSTIYAARSADQLIAVSHFTAKQLEKEIHTNRKKIKVVHEGVEMVVA
jgi:glycosyltransferase involved in cell wall biosynthesis